MKVDEQLRAQHAVDCLLARRMSSHETPECGRFVNAIVVDVHCGMRCVTFYEHIDHGLERRSFLGRRQRPERPVCERTVLVEQAHSKEELAAAFDGSRVSL